MNRFEQPLKFLIAPYFMFFTDIADGALHELSVLLAIFLLFAIDTVVDL